MKPISALSIGLGLAIGVAIASCGARTGLDAGGLGGGSLSPVTSSTRAATTSVSTSASGVVGSGGTSLGGGGGSSTVQGVGGGGGLPSIDSGPDVVHIEDCVEAGITYIYVISDNHQLFRFDPPSGQVTLIGTVDCAGDTNSVFSMAVDRSGIAYVVFQGGPLNAPPAGQLFRVDTANAACSATGFTTDQDGFLTFGMGYATVTNGPAERLYVAESNYSTTSKGLAYIDTNTFELNFIAPFSEDIGDAVELTGTGNGRLFAFSLPAVGGADTNSHLIEIDKNNGDIIRNTPLPIGNSESSFAFAFWGGDFYIFTDGGASGTPTVITRYRPSDGSLVALQTLTTHIVGVGVSTCAPE